MKGNLGHGHMNYLEPVMFSSFDLLIYFMQLPTLAAPLKIDFAPPQQWHIYIGLNHHHLLQHILLVLSQTSFPLSSCKIVAAPSGWVLNLITFDGSRPSFCPKRADTTDQCFPLTACLCCCLLPGTLPRKEEGLLKQDSLPKKSSFFRRKAPVRKFQSFLGCPLSAGEIHFYIWKYQVSSLLNLFVLCVFFSLEECRNILIYLIQKIFVEVETLFRNLRVSGPSVSMLLT